MLATVFLACSLFQWLLWGCPAEPGQPLTNTIIQTQQMQQQTEQQRIQAETARAAIQATAQAEQWSQETKQAALALHAATEQHETTQVFLNDRFAWKERERTERQWNLIMLFGFLALVAGGVAVVWMWPQRHQPPPVMLPRISVGDLGVMSPQKFVANAEQAGWHGYDIVEDEHGYEIGVRQLPGGPAQMVRLLPGGSADA